MNEFLLNKKLEDIYSTLKEKLHLCRDFRKIIIINIFIVSYEFTNKHIF